MTVFSQDSFTESSDVALSAHTGETGASWSVHPAGGDTFRILAADDFVKPASTGTTSPIYYSSGTPSGAEYDVEVDIIVAASSNSGAVGVIGRTDTSANTMYNARYSGLVSAYQLYKFVAGTATLLGSYSASPPVSAAAKLEIRDASKKLFVGGVERISSADNAITSAGRAGVRGFLNVANQSGLNLDNFIATDLSAGGVTLPIFINHLKNQGIM